MIGIRQIGMRPKLRVLGVEASGSDISSVLSPSATADVDGSAPSAILSPEATATAAPETEQPPDSSSSDDPVSAPLSSFRKHADVIQGTNLAVQSNSAVVSSASRVGVALLAGSLAALIQTF